MNLNDLAIFVAVAEKGSYSGAADELRIAKSTASQRVRALEAELGVSLVRRSPRSFALTEAGEALFARGHEIVSAATDAERLMGTLRDAPVGLLRVSAPVSFGRRYIGGVIARLLGEHAELRAELTLEDRDVDLIGERYDVAIRIGELPPSDLSARKVGSVRWSIVGAPSYLEARGRPETPDALGEHECLRFAHRRESAVWSFTRPDGGRQDVRVGGRLVCNQGDMLAEVAAAGLGLAWLPDFVLAPYLESGRLERVLEPFCDHEGPVHLVFPQRVHRARKVAVFAEALQAALAR